MFPTPRSTWRYCLVSLLAFVVSTGRARSGSCGLDPVCFQRDGPSSADNAEPHCQDVVADWPAQHATCLPVSMGEVQIRGFLGQRIQRNRAALLAAMDSQMPLGFEARAAGRDLPPEAMRLAMDSDLYKWLEGACYYFARTHDTDVKRHVDHIVKLILQCQQPDGYINTQVPPHKRLDTHINHDLYIAGHFCEAAVAHHRATGDERLLRAAQRWVDWLIAQRDAGHPYFEKVVGHREHNEYEIGFLRLYRETGNKSYLAFASQLARKDRVGPTIAETRANGGLHQVRFTYMLAGWTDLYLETGDSKFFQHLPALWRELTETRMYVTGGIGSRGEHISPRPFELPQGPGNQNADRHMGETCGAVGTIFWGWRMHAATGQSHYFDDIEKVLYNHLLGAISLDHLATFYYNPMRMAGDLSRYTDHGQRPCTSRCRLPKTNRTNCCMPNVMRLFGALPEYVFSRDEQGIFVNVYTTAALRHTLPDGRKVQLSFQTNYPHDGRVAIRMIGDRPVRFLLRLRIPGWCQMATVRMPDGQTVMVGGGDYYLVDRHWQPGDKVVLDMAMPVRMITPHPRVQANRSQVVFARGPLVYCLESEDVDFPVQRARVGLRCEEVAQKAHVKWQPDLLSGVHVLEVPGQVASGGSTQWQPVTLKLIPWYARGNRRDHGRWVVLLPWWSSGVTANR